MESSAERRIGREEKVAAGKLHATQYLVALVLAVLATGMWRLQVLGAEGYKQLAEANEKPIPDWVFHDLRRTMVSGMARLLIALPVIEKVVNHKSGTFRGIVSVYQHHDFAVEKRNALAAWANFVLSIISADHELRNVFELRGQR